MIDIQQMHQLIADFARADLRDGVPEYSPTNTAESLGERMRLAGLRVDDPRRGDDKYFRSLYTATRWLIRVHNNPLK